MLPLIMHPRGAYFTKIKRIFGSSLIGYWPLWEPGGLTAFDISGNGLHGAYKNTGETYGQAGIGDGKSAVLFDGATGNVNIYSAGLNAAFNGTLGGVLMWVKFPAGVWTDGTERSLIYIGADASNVVNLERTTTNNQLSFIYIAGGTNKTNNIGAGFSSTQWMRLGFFWNHDGDHTRNYVNGYKLPNTLSALGDWAGVLSSTRCAISAKAPDPYLPFNGTIAHVVLFNSEPTETQIRQDWLSAKPCVSGKTMSILGDSISTSAIGWQFKTMQGHTSPTELIRHSVDANSVMNGLDAQVVAAASDNADFIIIALGTNDNNTGDTPVLQAEAEENIVELKGSNPRATIYWMNVLPKWTDAVAGPEVDKGNIRTAIAAACTAQGITCWDTYTAPWITQAQTTDGTHPTAAGHTAIAAQVLTRL